jgi:hypothetical protein
MSKQVDRLTTTAGIDNYLTYSEVKAYLKKFLRWKSEYSRWTPAHTIYQHSSTLTILVRRLQPRIYDVRAYPLESVHLTAFAEALASRRYTGWLFSYNYRTHSIHYIIGSREYGQRVYKKVKGLIKDDSTLTRWIRVLSFAPKRAHAAKPRYPKRRHVNPH